MALVKQTIILIRGKFFRTLKYYESTLPLQKIVSICMNKKIVKFETAKRYIVRLYSCIFSRSWTTKCFRWIGSSRDILSSFYASSYDIRVLKICILLIRKSGKNGSQGDYKKLIAESYKLFILDQYDDFWTIKRALIETLLNLIYPSTALT